MNTEVCNEQNEYSIQGAIKRTAPPDIEHYINS